jgi:hypothetical protein
MFLAGYTGPSKNIGGSSPYHIDMKLSQSLPIAQRRAMFDSLAQKYADEGRHIEFSNPAVAGRRWDLNAEDAVKDQLLVDAAAAHSHNLHKGKDSYDFYVPYRGKDRWDKSAEGAPIYMPTITGGSVTTGQGGGYGRWASGLNPEGVELVRIGHGDVTRGGGNPNAIQRTLTTEGVNKPIDSIDTSKAMNAIKASLMYEALMPRKKQPDLIDEILRAEGISF